MGPCGLLGEQDLHPDSCGKPLKGTRQGRCTIRKDTWFLGMFRLGGEAGGIALSFQGREEVETLG